MNWFITILHREGADITRTFFIDKIEAQKAWHKIIAEKKGYKSETYKIWSKKMVTEWGVTLIQNQDSSSVYAIELWDRSLWSKDAPETISG